MQQAPHATHPLMPPHRTPPRSNLCAAWKAHTQLLRSALSADANSPQSTSLSDPHHRLPQASHITIPNPARLAHLVSGCLQLYKDSFDSANETTHSALASISGVDCSPLEAAFMWLGGWRPTSAITLVYSTLGLNAHEIVLTDRSSGQGQELEPPSLAAINQAPPSTPDSSLSDAQLAAVEALQRSTVDSELHLSNELATLQMLLPDQAMAEALTNDFIRKGHELMESKVADLAYLYAKANQLRLHTLEELLNLLNPMQSALCCVSAFELVYALKSLD